MQKQCPLCRQLFDCQNSDDCWCSRKEFKPFIGRIPDGLTECICENCLTHLNEKPVQIKKKRQEYVAGSNVAGIGP